MSKSTGTGSCSEVHASHVLAHMSFQHVKATAERASFHNQTIVRLVTIAKVWRHRWRISAGTLFQPDLVAFHY